MLLLCLLCAVIAALMLAVVGAWQRLASTSGGLAQEKALYAGFLSDIERRLARGDIDADLAHEERVEAARALLKAGDDPVAEPAAIKPLYPFLLLAAVAAVSFALYLLTGHPGLPDQPYHKRLQQWTSEARTQPDSLPPQAMAAVLRQGAVGHANDPAFWLFIGRIDMLAGNAYYGAKDYERALALDPKNFASWSELGEALTFVARGSVGSDALKAFNKALELDPKDARANYYLGKMALDNGQYDAARSHFELAGGTLAPDDPRRAAIDDQLRAVATAQTADKAMKARISGMVATLAAQLKAQPDNADGWARLLRSYDVLGDASGKAQAISAMQAHYRDRPAVAADILVKSQAAVGAEDTGAMN